MDIEQRLWREDVERDLQALRLKRSYKGSGIVTYRQYRRRFQVHTREGLRLGIPVDDAYLISCQKEASTEYKLCPPT